MPPNALLNYPLCCAGIQHSPNVASLLDSQLTSVSEYHSLSSIRGRLASTQIFFLYLFHDSMFPLKVASEGSEVQNLFLVARETSLGEVNGNSLRYVLYSNCLIQFTVRCF